MGAKILIVEDNEGIRKILRMTLETASYEILEAENGLKALKLLDEHPDCALVITDLAMPVLDGHELLSRLRDDADRSDLPVFVLSAEQDAAMAEAQRANRIIHKPFSPIELLDAVAEAVKGNTSPD